MVSAFDFGCVPKIYSGLSASRVDCRDICSGLAARHCGVRLPAQQPYKYPASAPFPVVVESRPEMQAGAERQEAGASTVEVLDSCDKNAGERALSNE